MFFMILKTVKVLCFDTLSQVFILNGLLGAAGCACRLRRRGWAPIFTTYDSAKWACYAERDDMCLPLKRAALRISG